MKLACSRQPDDETLVIAELEESFATALAADSPDRQPAAVPDRLGTRTLTTTCSRMQSRPRHRHRHCRTVKSSTSEIARFEVIHLPGHTPGSTVLFEQATGILFTGDVLYEGELLDELPESDIDSYVASMQRLLDLDVTWRSPVTRIR